MEATLVNPKAAALIPFQCTQLDTEVTVACSLWLDFERMAGSGKLWALGQDSSKVQGFGKVVVGWESVLYAIFFFLVFVPGDPFDIDT